MNPIITWYYRNRKRKQKRRYWVHPMLLHRKVNGEHLKLEEMHHKYPEKFFDYTRLTVEQFDYILKLISPTIMKQSRFRESIPAKTRLLITLRFLATGDSFRTIATNFSVGKSTVFSIVYETLSALWDTLGPLYAKAPSTSDDWSDVAKGFYDKWQFPNCVGAIDGKHVEVISPDNSGSRFFNYKGYFSIVLMATCDAHYRFTTIDVGGYGRQSDGGVFSNSGLGQSLNSGRYNLGEEKLLPGSSHRSTPMVLVGDEAFPLTKFLMRPFPAKSLDARKRIFNYRLSRARRVIENAFGILAARFRVFGKPINASPDNVSLIVKGAVALHNYILSCQLRQSTLTEPGTLNGSPDCSGSCFLDMPRSGSNMYSNVAREIRETFADHFLNEGSVPWQISAVQP